MYNRFRNEVRGQTWKVVSDMNSTMLSDKIENFILDLMDKQNSDQLLLKRKDVADRLACAPSQVTYVINTRFSANDRFIVESRRGSGGYIKISLRPIVREEVPDSYRRLKEAAKQYQTERSNRQEKDKPISQEEIENGLQGYFRMLLNYDIISEREYRLMYAMTHTMLEYCPEGHRKEAGRTMIHRIEWALKGE